MHHMTLTELAKGLKAGDFSSRELTASLLDRIERLDPILSRHL